jgi:hypothetical protein
MQHLPMLVLLALSCQLGGRARLQGCLAGLQWQLQLATALQQQVVVVLLLMEAALLMERSTSAE